uniref:protein adenylyltransferase SelO family protein n=1 Tax=Devosia sp. TaxID=1871048 RepID=UPI002AFE4FC5
GVLNTDNINITGESFDYGPWRFLPVYDPDFTAAYFDETGLYSFGRQPDTLAWNLTRLAECLLPLSASDALEAALNTVWPAFRAALAECVLGRLGLVPGDIEADSAFVAALFGFLGTSKAPYEQFFFDWRGGLSSEKRASKSPSSALYAGEAFAPLRERMGRYPATAGVNLDHPYFARSTPRTMLIEQVEAIWTPIAEKDDWSLFESTLSQIAQMRHAYGHTI